MGFAVVHMMKIGKGSVRGIQSHNQREKDPHTNSDIDKTRTKENYDLLGSHLNYHREINDRIKQLAGSTKTVRKDAVVLCNFIITSDEHTMKNLPLEKQRAFFEDSVNFFAERYGRDRLVNATVHMDETTPHMHIGLVPITKDGRLSAKSIFTRTELKDLQTDFAREVGFRYGLERGIEGSDRMHLSEQQFKAQQAEERAQEAQKRLSKAQKDIKILQQQEKALKGKIEGLQRDIMTAKQVKDVPYTKAMMSDKLLVAPADFEKLCKTAVTAEELLKEIKPARRINAHAKEILQDAQSRGAEIVKKAQEKADSVSERLKSAEYRQKLKHIENVINSSPQLVKDYQKAENDLQLRQRVTQPIR